MKVGAKRFCSLQNIANIFSVELQLFSFLIFYVESNDNNVVYVCIQTSISKTRIPSLMSQVVVYADCRWTAIQVYNVHKGIQSKGSSADPSDEAHRSSALSVWILPFGIFSERKPSRTHSGTNHTWTIPCFAV